jgi:hypothetical protein
MRIVSICISFLIMMQLVVIKFILIFIDSNNISLFINFTQKVSNLVVEPCLLELKLFRPNEHEKWKKKIFTAHHLI